jgi:hypothetical protein
MLRNQPGKHGREFEGSEWDAARHEKRAARGNEEGKCSAEIIQRRSTKKAD